MGVQRYSCLLYTSPQEVERLVSALAEIKRRYQTDGSGLLSQEYIDPVVAADGKIGKRCV